MTTGLIPDGDRVLDVTFDFVGHNLVVTSSDGQVKIMPLMPRSVADFYRESVGVLRSIGVDVTTNPTTRPVTQGGRSRRPREIREVRR